MVHYWSSSLSTSSWENLWSDVCCTLRSGSRHGSDEPHPVKGLLWLSMYLLKGWLYLWAHVHFASKATSKYKRSNWPLYHIFSWGFNNGHPFWVCSALQASLDISANMAREFCPGRTPFTCRMVSQGISTKKYVGKLWEHGGFMGFYWCLPSGVISRMAGAGKSPHEMELYS